MLLQKLINMLGLNSYYFAVSVNNKYNTTGKVELWTLNSEEPVAVGWKECLKELRLYVKYRNTNCSKINSINDKNKKFISLETYKYSSQKKGLNGKSKTVKIDKDWLKKKIHPQTLDDFLNEYTYDDVEYLYEEYKNEIR